jgi:6-pyruvoyltetrahydropterin/6-carboxytetrahydropterin synthase
MHINTYNSTKTYGHERGLSCAFRQWRADSHCNLLHGYSLSFTFVFGGSSLDEKNWIVDFGNLKRLEQWLKDNFDHKTAVADDDPMYGLYAEMNEKQLIDMVVMQGVGCELFAKFAFDFASSLIEELYGDRCWVESVEVREHGSNSAKVNRVR